MQNVDNTNSEKPKGNMLQNENREDEALTENSTGVVPENQIKKQDKNVVKQTPLKTEEVNEP